MNTRFATPLILAALLLTFLPAPSVPATASDEAAMNDEKYAWDLTDLYPNDEAWVKAKKALEGRIPAIDQYRGRLGESSAVMAEAFSLISSISKEYARIRSYASLNSDTDTREAGPLAMKQEIGQVGTTLGAAVSFVDPEILALDPKVIDGFLAEEPALLDYRMLLDDLQRRREHTLGEGEEEVIANASLVSGAPFDLYGIFVGADMPYPTVELSTGEKVLMDQSAYTKHRSSPVREDRIAVFDAFWTKFNEFGRTLGTSLYSGVKRDLFYAKVRNYDSSLESALDSGNIPTDVYHTLIREVNASLPTLHRYLKLRQRMLGLDELHYYDIYPPIVKEVEMDFPYEDGVKLMLESLAPLGEEYVNGLAGGVASRWIDVYPSQGKRSGAYMSGSAYDVHPYMLLNYVDDYNSLSTLAHECGHAMQTYFSNMAQPYPTADYTIFVAEIASTLNEALLNPYLLEKAESDEEKLFLLGSYLDNLRGTFYRQTMFAEFELKIHELVEKGEALTGDRLNEVYGELLRRYHGHDEGVMTINPLYNVEWAYIRHFYYNFYVYQYSTSFVASTALAQKILDGEEGALERYMDFLKAGSSDYSVELVKKAGVDLTSPEPYRATVQVMNDVMDQIEAILDKQVKE